MTTKITSRNIIAELRTALDKMRNGPKATQVLSACDISIRYFNIAESRLKEWKQAVFSGARTLDANEERDLKEIFEAIGFLSESVLGEIDRLFSVGSMPVEKWDIVQLRGRSKKAKKIVANWSSPKRSTAMALRTRKLSSESEGKLKAILQIRAANE